MLFVIRFKRQKFIIAIVFVNHSNANYYVSDSFRKLHGCIGLIGIKLQFSLKWKFGISDLFLLSWIIIVKYDLMTQIGGSSTIEVLQKISKKKLLCRLSSLEAFNIPVD